MYSSTLDTFVQMAKLSAVCIISAQVSKWTMCFSTVFEMDASQLQQTYLKISFR